MKPKEFKQLQDALNDMVARGVHGKLKWGKCLYTLYAKKLRKIKPVPKYKAIPPKHHGPDLTWLIKHYGSPFNAAQAIRLQLNVLRDEMEESQVKSCEQARKDLYALGDAIINYKIDEWRFNNGGDAYQITTQNSLTIAVIRRILHPCMPYSACTLFITENQFKELQKYFHVAKIQSPTIA
jgi:hypothetical protein